MSFREVVHRHLLALERCDRDSRGFAVVHLLYCETPPGEPTLARQSHLTLVFEKQDGEWVRVHDHASAI